MLAAVCFSLLVNSVANKPDLNAGLIWSFSPIQPSVARNLRTRNDGNLMLRNRTRLSTVGLVVLGTIVSTNPHVQAQQSNMLVGAKQPTDAGNRAGQASQIPSPPNRPKQVGSYTPAKLSIGTGGGEATSNGPAQTSSGGRSILLGDRELEPGFLLQPDNPSMEDLNAVVPEDVGIQLRPPATSSSGATVPAPPMPASSIVTDSQSSSRSAANPIPTVETNSVEANSEGKPRTSRSILLEFGEGDNDFTPFGMMANGMKTNGGSSKSSSAATSARGVAAQKETSMGRPSTPIAAPPITAPQAAPNQPSQSGQANAQRGAMHLGPVATPIDIQKELLEHGIELGEGEYIESPDQIKIFDSTPDRESSMASDELLAEEFAGDTPVQSPAFESPSYESAPNYRETINDVYEEIGASETDLLDVDPGLPDVDPEQVEDVSMEHLELDELIVNEHVDAPEVGEDIATSVEPAREIVREIDGRPIRTPRTIQELGGNISDRSPQDRLNGRASTEFGGADGNSRSHIELQEEWQQEAPVIDVRRSQSRKSEEGVNAHLAVKPISVRREHEQAEGYTQTVDLPPIISGEQVPALNPVDAFRLERTNACLSHYLNNPESTSVRSPWAVMHALIAFGADYELQHGDSRVNAIGWMCHNGTCRTQRMFTPRGNGFVPNVGAGVQGHEGQFLSILAQSNVPLDYPIQIGTNQFSVEDLVRYEMATCKERSELTFKLIGLSYYLDSNKQWKANDGRVWSIQKLIQEELAQPVVGSACGGTHRLMGFSFAVRQRAMQGQPIDGQFARANQFVKAYIDYTWKLQNPDGSFSTSWYEGRGNEPNDERKVQTTGHMLEWLMYTLPDSEINQPRVQKSIDFLLSKIYDKKEHNWPIGPRGHATRAIALYQARYLEIMRSSPELLKPTMQVAKVDNTLAIPGPDGTVVRRPNPNAGHSQGATSGTARNANAQSRQPARGAPAPFARARGYRR